MATHVIDVEPEKGENLPINTESAVDVSPDVEKDIKKEAQSLCTKLKKCYDLKQQVERVEKHRANLTGKLCALKNAKSVKRYLLTESTDMESIVKEMLAADKKIQDLLQWEKPLKFQDKGYFLSRMKFWNREQDEEQHEFLNFVDTSDFESSLSVQQRRQELETELYFKMKKEQQVKEKLRKLELELGLDFGNKPTDFGEIFASLKLRKKEIDRLERRLEKTFKDIPGNLDLHEKYKHYASSVIKKKKEKILLRKDSKFVLQVLECVVNFQETDVTPLILLCRYATDEMFDALLEPSDGLDVGNILKENGTIWEKRYGFAGFTLIHCAATNRSSHILRYIFEKKPVNEEDLCDECQKGFTPLHYAALAGSVKNIDFLLKRLNEAKKLPDGSNFLTEENCLQILKITSRNRDPEVFKCIFDYYIKSDCRSCSENDEEEPLAETKEIRDAIKIAEALRLAAKNNSFECVSAVWELLCKEYEEGELNLNRISNPLNDAMQYFIKEGNVYWTTKILQINGSLGKKNLKCEAPIDSISYSTMKKLLDMQISGDKEKDSKIILTNIFGDPKSGHDIENIQTIAKSSNDESSKNEKLFNLALHPLCQAIVSVKYRSAYYMYLIETLFLFFFIYYILNLSHTQMQINNFNLQNNTESNDETINHYLTTMAFERKWTEYFFIFYIVSKLVVISLSVYLSLSMDGCYVHYRQIKTMLRYYRHDHRSGLKKLRSLLQLGWKEYLQYHDWHEYILLLFTFLLLYFALPPVFAVISAFFSLFMVISQHPSILPLRFMFAQILYRYITVLIFSFALIGGFALSFYMIDYGERCTEDLFETPYLATLKVISMMTGDYSFDSFKKSTNIQILFIFFIILIVCCLFNMMNGLAFNITSELKKSAKVSRTLAQCQLIANFQPVLKMIELILEKSGKIWRPYENVAKLKVNLKSGTCKIAEEYNASLNMHTKSIEDGEFFFDEVDLRTPKLIKWVWINRGHKLDAQILRDLNRIRGVAKTKQKIDSSDEEIEL